jgi:HprK-related kinase B
MDDYNALEQSRQSLVVQYRESFPAQHALFLAFAECKIAVRTNSRILLARLEDYFRSFRTDDENAHIFITAHEASPPRLSLPFVIKKPDPGKTKIKEEYVDLPDGRIVRKRLTGMVFVFGQEDNLAVGPCVENANQVVNFINNRYIEWRLNQGCLLGHAAGVIRNGRGLALAGFSGMGKSTLALHLMSKGATFVSNDRMLVEKKDNALIMHGVAKQPRINPGTALANSDLSRIISAKDRDRFLSLSGPELWNLEHKYDAPIEECFGPGRFVLSGSMDGLVILNWRREKSSLQVQTVDLTESIDLLSAFRKEKGLFYLHHDESMVLDPPLDDYAELLSDCTIIEMAGGTDFSAATDQCLRFLETGVLSN